jgi:PII-like signaling protein
MPGNINHIKYFTQTKGVVCMHRDVLIEQIEYSRQQMNELSKHLPLIAEEVVELSQEIDQLLNQYQRINDKD